MNLDIYAPGHPLYDWSQQMLAAQSNNTPRSSDANVNSSSTNQRSVGGQVPYQREEHEHSQQHHKKANNASLVEQKRLAIPSIPKGTNPLVDSKIMRTSQLTSTTAPISSRTTDRPSSNASRPPAVSKPQLLHTPSPRSGANMRELDDKQQPRAHSPQNDTKQSSRSTSSDNCGKEPFPAKRSLDGTAKSRPLQSWTKVNVPIIFRSRQKLTLMNCTCNHQHMFL